MAAGAFGDGGRAVSGSVISSVRLEAPTPGIGVRGAGGRRARGLFVVCSGFAQAEGLGSRD